jgi:hypothetical protein
MAAHGDSSDAGDEPLFDPSIGESISVGADVRSQFLWAADTTLSSFHFMTAAVYGHARLSRDISAFLKFDAANAGYGERSGPEVYLLARVLPGRWYVRGGDFLPSYGMRIDDHTGYTRGGDLGSVPGSAAGPGLIFVPNYKDIGIEIGGAAGDLEVAAGVFNGTGNSVRIDFRQAKAFAARLEYAAQAGGVNMVLGASGYHFDVYAMGGVHAGIGGSGFALYGEADFTRNRLSPSGFSVDRGAHAMAAFAAAEYLVARGIWLTAKYDVFDPSRGGPSDSYERLTLGMELFPWPFVEVRPQFRINGETPGVDNNTALVQLHTWF